MTRILLIGSNFLASAIFAKLFAFNDIDITLLDRKDPTTIQNYNNDTYRILRKYCQSMRYQDLYNGRVFGDAKNNKKITFSFKDWVNEPLFGMGGFDIIIHAGSIYDNLYAQRNQKETQAVNILGLNNILNGINPMADKRPLFIHMSSINVYGDQTNKNEELVTEDSIPNPQSLLDFTLYTQENMLKALAKDNEIDYLVLRLGTLVGEFTPRDSLVTAAVSSLLLQQKEFEVRNPEHSIELLDMRDLGNLINIIMSLYLKNNYEPIKNQIFNIKCEEKEEKTVKGIVESIFGGVKSLPTITHDHIRGISDFKLKPPKIAVVGYENKEVKFDKPVSGEKALKLLNFNAMNPIINSLYTYTVNYLLNYVLVDFSDQQRQIFTKIFYLPSTPTPEVVDERVNQDVKNAVKEIGDNIAQNLG